MKTLKRLGYVATTAVAMMLVAASLRQDTFHVERSKRIAAPPEWVFAQINDLQRMKAWNPYERKDPSLKSEFGPKTQGLGASYAWESDKVATGRMTIVDVQAAAAGDAAARFREAVPVDHDRRIYAQARPRRHQVTWAVQGPANFMHKLMETAFILDPLIGSDLDQGLGNLKVFAEAH